MLGTPNVMMDITSCERAKRQAPTIGPTIEPIAADNGASSRRSGAVTRAAFRRFWVMTRRSGAGTLAVAMPAAMLTGSVMLKNALSVLAKVGLACSSQVPRVRSTCAAESAEPGTSPDEGMANAGCKCRWARARMAGLRWTLAAWCAACSASLPTASTKRARILIGQASSVARVSRRARHPLVKKVTRGGRKRRDKPGGKNTS